MHDGVSSALNSYSFLHSFYLTHSSTHPSAGVFNTAPHLLCLFIFYLILLYLDIIEITYVLRYHVAEGQKPKTCPNE